MKKISAFFIFTVLFNFQWRLFSEQTAWVDFENLSETSRPIELKYIHGTNTQTGLLAGLFNHDSIEVEIKIKRGTLLKSVDAGVQSMLIAATTTRHKQALLAFHSCLAEWQASKSQPIYSFILPPQTLTEIPLNAVCTELDKNPPGAANNQFTVASSEKQKEFAQLFAAIDKINNEMAPAIEQAIVASDGTYYTLNRDLTAQEQIILANLDDGMFLSYNTLNYAVWAITDNLNKEKMFAKMQEWSGYSSDSGMDIQCGMTRLILEIADLNEYAKKFE